MQYASVPHIAHMLQEVESEKRKTGCAGSTDVDLKPPGKRARRATDLGDDKNATPDPPSRPSESCLDDVRPLSVGMDRSAQSPSDPATQRESAVAAFGDGSINVAPSPKRNGFKTKKTRTTTKNNNKKHEQSLIDH